MRTQAGPAQRPCVCRQAHEAAGDALGVLSAGLGAVIMPDHADLSVTASFPAAGLCLTVYTRDVSSILTCLLRFQSLLLWTELPK